MVFVHAKHLNRNVLIYGVRKYTFRVNELYNNYVLSELSDTAAPIH